MADITRRNLLAAAAIAPGLARAEPGVIAARSFDLELAPGLIHLNTASVGPVSASVRAAVADAWMRLERDPVRMTYGREPDTVVSQADAVRGKVAALIGCDSDEVLLTSGTTDGMIKLAQALPLVAGDRVLMTDQEHEGGETGWLYRGARDGIGIDRVALPFGQTSAETLVARFAAALRPRTRAIIVSHVVSASGLRMPVAAIARLARDAGALCIVDGAQAVGQMPVDVRRIGCDAYAASGHKWLMGPKGTGFLYIARPAQERLGPRQWLLTRDYGGNSSGTGPAPLMVGLGLAIDRIDALGTKAVEQHNAALAARISAGLAVLDDLSMIGPRRGELASALVAARLPDAIDSRVLRDRMRGRHGIIIKMAEKRWFNGIRLSPHIFNDAAQVDAALNALRIELDQFGA